MLPIRGLFGELKHPAGRHARTRSAGRSRRRRETTKPKFPYYPLVGEVYEAHSVADALRKINEDGFVMISGTENAETKECIFCLGKLDLSRMK